MKLEWLRADIASARRATTFLAVLLTGSLLVNDRMMLDEMLRFKKQDSGKFECKSPDHDDSIFKWGIAYQMLNHKPNKPIMDVIDSI